MAEVIFMSSKPVELHSVEGSQRRPLVGPPAEGETGHPLVIETLQGTGKNYPLLAAYVTVGPVSWAIKAGCHAMRSATDDGEPSFIFSSVNEKNPELFYCCVLGKGTPKDELASLEEVLGKLTVYHTKKQDGGRAFTMPNIPLPSIGITKEQVNEVLRKGAEDTQNVLKMAGEGMSNMFHAAAEMHKKYAPKPKETPMEVSPALRDKIAKSKQATAAGAAVAKGVATGMQAATVEIGTSLMNVAGDKKGGGGGGGGGVMDAPAVKAVGGVGMEILRDIAAVRDAMVGAVGTAWSGLKDATVEVFDHQYGAAAAATVQDGAEVVEGIANMGLAMKMTQPTQVMLTSAKESEAKDAKAIADKAAAAGASATDKLAAEKAALEKELAKLKAEKEALAKGTPTGSQQQQQQQQQRGPFGLPFAFGGGK